MHLDAFVRKIRHELFGQIRMVGRKDTNPAIVTPLERVNECPGAADDRRALTVCTYALLETCLDQPVGSWALGGAAIKHPYTSASTDACPSNAPACSAC